MKLVGDKRASLLMLNQDALCLSTTQSLNDYNLIMWLYSVR